jgi:hypothetical protein
MSGDSALRMIAFLLPRAARARYLEEWRSDSQAAAEAGLRRRDVLRGAAMLTLTLDRDLPAHTGEPRGTVPRRLARRGLALFAAAVVVLAGSWMTGGGIVPVGPGASPEMISTLSAVGWMFVCLAMLAVLAGVFYVGSAALVARTAFARTAFGAAVAGPIIVAAAAILDFQPFVLAWGILLALIGCTAGLAVVTGPSPLSLERRVATRSQRLPLALAGAAVVAAVIVSGAADLLVWNPQSKVPALGIDAIYARMISVDQFQPAAAIGAVVVWAVFWGGLAAVVVILAAQRRHTWMTPRRVSILLLTIIGGAVLFRFFAGFGIGMSIADTWATSGVGTSIASAVLPYVGQLALAGAVVLNGWAPKVHQSTAPVA